MNLDAQIKKYQKKIDVFLLDHRLKLLIELSDAAKILLLGNKLMHGQHNNQKSTLSFRNEEFDWSLILTTTPQENKIQIFKHDNKPSLFEWVIKSSGDLNRFKASISRAYTISDMSILQETINPMIENITTIAMALNRANLEDGLELLKEDFLNQRIEKIELDLLDNAYFILENGTKVLANDKLNARIKYKQHRIKH